jgi:tetratricopeptide (TPR) repeat protein
MADLLHQLQTALAGRYRVERELGMGGMAVVFLAMDERHDRHVAVKVLRPNLTPVIGSDRFLQEIAIAARLTHPHILPLHDSGEAAGFLFYVMPYVEGESLRGRLTRERVLPVGESLRIAREVADALAYAHTHGIVHRDIKPENILLESGHAVVSDFGVARAIGAAAGDRLTSAGVALGTPAYMSPEQAAGESIVDARTDLYALGCTLYEMLAGQPPFTGPTAESVVHQHIVAAPTPVTAIRPSVPASVAAALDRALAKEPADRFATAAEFTAALEAPTETHPMFPGLRARHGRAMLVAGAAALAVGGWIALAVRRSSPATVELAATPPERTVAVLPFRTVGPGVELWREGLVDLLSTNLDNVGTLRAIDSRTLLSRWRKRAGEESGEAALATALQVARETGAGFGVVGSVIGLGPNVRLTAKIYRVPGGEVMGEGRAEGPQDSILPLVDALSVEILKRVLGAAPAREVRLSTVTTPSLAALRHFLDGEQAFRRSDFARAIAEYRSALAIDSTFALPLYRLSSAYGWTEVIGAPEALHYGRRAVAFADRLPERERLLLTGNLLLEAGRPAAIDTLERATLRYPDDPEAWYIYGDALYHLGFVRNIPATRTEAAFERAIAVDPTFAPAMIHGVGISFLLDDSARARRYVDQYISIDSQSTVAVGVRAAFDLSWGGPRDSAAALRRLAAADPDAVRQAIINGLAWRVKSLRLAGEIQSQMRLAGLPEDMRAFRYAGFFPRMISLGRPREALRSLREGYRSLNRPNLRALALILSAAGYLPPEEVREDLDASRRDSTDVSLWARGVVEAARGSPASADHARRLREQAVRLRNAGDALAAERREGLAAGLEALARGFRGDRRGAVSPLREAVEQFGAGDFISYVVSTVHRLYLAAWLAERPEGEQEALEILSTTYVPFRARADQLSARIYERQGRTAEAAVHYGQVIEMWRDAEPELQPAVAEARAALERLTAEP